MDIFSVLSRHVDWLSQRHAVSAGNVANVDTPGYKAKKIGNFDLSLAAASESQLMRTSDRHLDASPGEAGSYDVSLQNNADVSLSGNDVTLEKEMATIGDTSRMFAFDTALERTFQRMFITSLKG